MRSKRRGGTPIRTNTPKAYASHIHRKASKFTIEHTHIARRVRLRSDSIKSASSGLKVFMNEAAIMNGVFYRERRFGSFLHLSAVLNQRQSPKRDGTMLAADRADRAAVLVIGPNNLRLPFGSDRTAES